MRLWAREWVGWDAPQPRARPVALGAAPVCPPSSCTFATRPPGPLGAPLAQTRISHPSPQSHPLRQSEAAPALESWPGTWCKGLGKRPSPLLLWGEQRQHQVDDPPSDPHLRRPLSRL